MPVKTDRSSSRSGKQGNASRTVTARSRSVSTARQGARNTKKTGSISLVASMLELISLTYFGRVFFFLAIATILALLNILLSHNQFDFFFRLLGIEMVLTAIFFWLKFLLKRE